MTASTIAYYVCCLLSFVPAIVLHEVSHGFAAWKLGDPTARNAGRLTLNPIAHVDVFGTIILPLIMMLANGPVFGYAKPVPYNPTYFKNRRTGDFIVGMAGPAANLVMALIGAVVAHLLVTFGMDSLSGNIVYAYAVVLFLPLFTTVNLYLMFFNLIPVPPLDGSSIFALFIPQKYMGTYYKIERYAMPVLLVLLFLVPYATGFSPISAYLNLTAGNLAGVLLPTW